MLAATKTAPTTTTAARTRNATATPNIQGRTIPTTTTKTTPTAKTTINAAQNTAAAAVTATTTTTLTRKTTITSDPGILCFHHCNVKVFCFTLPRICPNCQTELYALPATDDDDDDGDDNDHDNNDDYANNMKSNGHDGRANNKNNNNNYDDDDDDDHKNNNSINGLNNGIDSRRGRIWLASKLPKLLPFRLPYPFVRAAQYPCAIVLRPSTGDFLNDYNNSTDLHIAVTTSTGCIVEFDRHGLQRHRPDSNAPEWWQCLLVGDVPEPWYDYWDQILHQTCKQQPARWTIEQYDEQTHNCYTFVLAFLQALAYEKLSGAARSKTSFCERFIVPRTTTAGKYISLYRKLRAVGIYVHAAKKHHTKSNGNNNNNLNGLNGGGKTKRFNGKIMQLGTKTISGAAATTTTAAQLTGTTTTTVSSGGTSSMSGVSNGNSFLLRAPTLCTIEE